MAWKYSQSPLVLSTLDDTLTEKGERLFHTHSVREYLFDGVSIQNYMDLLSLAGTLGIDTNSFEIPKQLLDGDFGFFEDVIIFFSFCNLAEFSSSQSNDMRFLEKCNS